MSAYLIVGAKFRPPAQALLNTLPIGTPLLARREPSNPHDNNAIMVLVQTVHIDKNEQLYKALESFGVSLDELFAQPDWQLGYVPREKAAILAANWDRKSVRAVEGRLTFGATGMPSIFLGEVQ